MRKVNQENEIFLGKRELYASIISVILQQLLRPLVPPPFFIASAAEKHLFLPPLLLYSVADFNMKHEIYTIIR